MWPLCGRPLMGPALLLLLFLCERIYAATTTEYGVASTTIENVSTIDPELVGRGVKKFGDKCESTQECGFKGSFCDKTLRSCQCVPELSATNHVDKCGKAASINESCFFNAQCEAMITLTECRDNRCVCKFEMTPVFQKDNKQIMCEAIKEQMSSETYIDPAMIGVLVGMALMFVIICVVLRLFSNARWRENRTIFNTPNPRLMNVSLLREKHNERRGSRGPSRQPSMASLRPHSPGSQGTAARTARCTAPNTALAPLQPLQLPPVTADAPRVCVPPGSDEDDKAPNHHVNSASIPMLESVTVDVQRADA